MARLCFDMLLLAMNDSAPLILWRLVTGMRVYSQSGASSSLTGTAMSELPDVEHSLLWLRQRAGISLREASQS